MRISINFFEIILERAIRSVYVCIYLLLIPPRVAIFFKMLSPLYTLSSIGAFLSTIVNGFWFDWVAAIRSQNKRDVCVCVYSFDSLTLRLNGRHSFDSRDRVVLNSGISIGRYIGTVIHQA